MIFKVSVYYGFLVMAAVFILFLSNANGQERYAKLDLTRPFVKCWEIKNSGINDFASDNDYALISKSDGNVTLINTRDKTHIWNIPIGNKINSRPFIQEDKIIILSQKTNESKTTETYLRLIDLKTGITNWIQPIEETESIIPIKQNQQKSILTITKNSKILSLNTTSGKINWNRDFNNKVEIFSINQHSIHILTKQNKLFHIELSDGTITNQKQLKTKDISIISAAETTLYAGNKKGTLYEVTDNSETGEKLLRTGGKISLITQTGKNILIASHDNFIHYYSLHKREITWKKRLPGRISLEPQIIQNTAITTTYAEPEIYFINLTDGTPINQINLEKDSVIRKIQTDLNGILILTNNGLLRYGSSEDCKP